MALGPELPAVFSKDDEVAAGIAAAGEAAGDPVWRLPLHPGYRRMLDSKVWLRPPGWWPPLGLRPEVTGAAVALNFDRDGEKVVVGVPPVGCKGGLMGMVALQVADIIASW